MIASLNPPIIKDVDSTFPTDFAAIIRMNTATKPQRQFLVKALIQYIRTMDRDFRRRETSETMIKIKSDTLKRQIDRMEGVKDVF